MLRNNHEQNPRRVPFSSSFLSPSQLPSNQTREPTNITPVTINDDLSDHGSESDNLKIAQLNCFNRQVVMENLFANNTFDILILQEPWVNPFTLRLPTHPAWHEIAAYDYIPKTYDEKTRTGIYITKRVKSWNFSILPSGSPFITAVELTDFSSDLPSIRVLSVYNPPRHNTGLPVLEGWLKTYNNRRTPTVIGVDANLHHPAWNPVNYHHTHTISKELIKMCGQAGFKLQSQRQVPTFYPRARGKPTTIDHTWINYKLSRHQVKCSTSSDNHGSDHQLLVTEIQLHKTGPVQEHNSARLDKLDKASYYVAVENQLSKICHTLNSTSDIDIMVESITDVLLKSFLKQGKMVKTNEHRHKAWWNEDKLRPMIKERNRARKWMVLSRTREATQCYWE